MIPFIVKTCSKTLIQAWENIQNGQEIDPNLETKNAQLQVYQRKLTPQNSQNSQNSQLQVHRGELIPQKSLNISQSKCTTRRERREARMKAQIIQDMRTQGVLAQPQKSGFPELGVKIEFSVRGAK